MIVLGALVILASIAFGIVLLFGISMTDGPLPIGYALWSQLWPTYLGIAVGVLLIASKWLP